jgi:RimJ/RimL family protein N-acetyltransferase
MLREDAFRDKKTLAGAAVRLEPLGPEHYSPALLEGLDDPWVRKATATRATFTEAQLREWGATRKDEHGRADWAIIRVEDGAYVGDCALNNLSPQDASANYRIALVNSTQMGHGYGTEATRLVVDYALDVVGLHRVSLEVYAFNEPGRRTYAKSGFVEEGRLREALCWEGEWHDAIVMSILAGDPRPWHA